MRTLENALRRVGFVYVAGADEVGRGCLAGPVVAGAVVLDPGRHIPGVCDSKAVPATERQRLYDRICRHAVAWAVAAAEPDEIDRINIYWAGILAMRRAVDGLAVSPQHLLLDARRLKDVDVPQQAIIRGDSKSACIAAASILAKTSRDAVMRELDQCHPGYGFADHKGYPVRLHYTAVQQLGACPAHRRSFAPVREVLGLPPLPPWPTAVKSN